MQNGTKEHGRIMKTPNHRNLNQNQIEESFRRKREQEKNASSRRTDKPACINKHLEANAKNTATCLQRKLPPTGGFSIMLSKKGA